jgi:hypothetical protein
MRVMYSRGARIPHKQAYECSLVHKLRLRKIFQ